MMKRMSALLLIMCLAAGFAPAQVVKETRDVKGFTKVNLGIAGNLSIKIGPEFSVVLEGTKSDLEEVITDLAGEKLLIKQNRWRFNFNEKVNVYVTMPELNGVGVSGSGKAEIMDAVKTGTLDLDVSGSGRLVTSSIEAETLDCGISGSGNIILGSGTVGKTDLSISGSGNFDGQSLEVNKMGANISGSGSARCYVTGSLKASISGSGNISYKGDPSIDARVSGSGHVRSLK